MCSGTSPGSLRFAVGEKETSAGAGSRHEKGVRALFGHQSRHKKALVPHLQDKSDPTCAVSTRPLLSPSPCLFPDIVCNSEGTQHGCGHYIVTRKLSKEDCGNQFCMNSDMHPQGRCNGCGQTCKRVRPHRRLD